MYLPTPYSTVVALDPETGKELWVYKLEHGRPAGRGVAYWPERRQDSRLDFVWHLRTGG